MEHVKGESITTFCDRHRLTIKQRLFIPVCEAVQHAHMKGIIRRDLKPGNILIATVGDQHVGDGAGILTTGSGAARGLAWAMEVRKSAAHR